MARNHLDTHARDEINFINYCSPKNSEPNFQMVSARASRNLKPKILDNETNIIETSLKFGDVNPLLSSADWSFEELQLLVKPKISFVKKIKALLFS